MTRLGRGYHIVEVVDDPARVGWKRVILIEQPSFLISVFGGKVRHRCFVRRPGTVTNWYEDVNGRLRAVDDSWKLFLCERVAEWEANQAYAR